MLRAHGRGPVHLGQPVDVGQLEAHALHAFDHGLRRCCTGDHAVDGVADARPQAVRRIDQHVMHNRCPAEMGDAMAADERRRPSPPPPGAGTRWCPPALPRVQGKHQPLQWNIGQRPQIDREVRHAPGDRVADRVQVSPAMVQHHALRVAGCARRVVQRNRVPLVCGQAPAELGVAGVEECLVGHLAEQVAARRPRGHRCRSPAVCAPACAGPCRPLRRARGP